jgi:hypothetical protein
MGLQKIVIFLFIGILLLVNSQTANAVIIKDFEFSVDGVLPSADPEI